MIYKKGGVSGAELVEHNNFDYKYNYEFWVIYWYFCEVTKEER
jgi:hypothetical protein